MAVLLSKFEDMSYADIATTMEMSPEGDQVAAVAGARESARGAGTLSANAATGPTRE